MPLLCGEDRNINLSDNISESVSDRTHQESWSLKLANNKVQQFARNMGFVCKDTITVGLPSASPVDMHGPSRYLQLISQVLLGVAYSSRFLF